jgi:hypothetical protein
MSLENKITDLTQAIHTLTITLENHMAAMSDIPVSVTEPEFVKETIEIEPGNTVIDVVAIVESTAEDTKLIVEEVPIEVEPEQHEELPARTADEVRELAKTIIKGGLLTRSEVKTMISELGASEINKLSEEGLSSLYAQLEGHKE